jgi:hypothetical protein
MGNAVSMGVEFVQFLEDVALTRQQRLPMEPKTVTRLATLVRYC